MRIRNYLTASALGAILLTAGCTNNNNTAANVSVSSNTAASGSSSSAPAASASVDTAGSAAVDLTGAIDSYRTYVIQETDALVKDTGAFVDAINSGNIEEAKKLYAPARMHYERIEPIAEALGDLDPSIDARDGDVDPAEWRGFHRLEKALWEDKSTDGTREFADRLLSDTKLLRAKVETVEIEPSLLVTGAVELLNEVSTSKVTGEEDRYSRTDLYDFAANVEGAEKIYELLKPSLAVKDAELDKKIGSSFKVLQEELNVYAKDGGYVSYDVLKEEEVRKLSQNLDALAEPLSQMGTLLGV